MAARIAGLAFEPYLDFFMDLLETNQQMKETFKGTFKLMAWASGGTMAGGVVAGPPGALFGGFVGAVYGYWYSDKYMYSSMISAIHKLSDTEKAELVKKVQERVGSSSLGALKAFIESPVHREILIYVIQSI